ncbi:MAG: hypothetical protein JSS36_05620 [Proteobacteria bacterium]|nr:hypothetical protein [Pseudomonadota bacterium]
MPQTDPAPPESLGELAGEYVGAGVVAALVVGALVGMAAPRGWERRLGKWLGPALSLVEYLARPPR